jgi:hypothetical protein
MHFEADFPIAPTLGETGVTGAGEAGNFYQWYGLLESRRDQPVANQGNTFRALAHRHLLRKSVA